MAMPTTARRTSDVVALIMSHTYSDGRAVLCSEGAQHEESRELAHFLRSGDRPPHHRDDDVAVAVASDRESGDSDDDLDDDDDDDDAAAAVVVPKDSLNRGRAREIARLLSERVFADWPDLYYATSWAAPFCEPERPWRPAQRGSRVLEGVEACPLCHSMRTLAASNKQTRSGDEALHTYVTCLEPKCRFSSRL